MDCGGLSFRGLGALEGVLELRCLDAIGRLRLGRSDGIYPGLLLRIRERRGYFDVIRELELATLQLGCSQKSPCAYIFVGDADDR